MRRGGLPAYRQAAGTVAEGLARGKRLPAERLRRLLALAFDVCPASDTPAYRSSRQYCR